jgi:hypothetical protein
MQATGNARLLLEFAILANSWRSTYQFTLSLERRRSFSTHMLGYVCRQFDAESVKRKLLVQLQI